MSSTDIKPAAARVARAERRRRSVDTPDTAREVIDARRDLAESKVRAAIERALESAPPLTDEQRTRLARLLLAGAA